MDIAQLTQSINRAFSKLPPELGALPEDVRHAARLLAQRVLSEMDCVTREEFEVQQQVLYRTRMKVEALEKRLEALEAARSDQTSAAQEEAPSTETPSTPSSFSAE